MNNKILLGMSFLKNSDEALVTAENFAANLAGSSLHVVLGLETEGNRASLDDVMNRVRKLNFSEAYLWDSNVNRTLLRGWPDNLPIPYSQEGFGYGDVWNRLTCMANVSGAEFITRIDPGTRPFGKPGSFEKLLERHITELSAGKADVVSGAYSGRLAIRDNFVPKKHRAWYHKIKTESRYFARYSPTSTKYKSCHPSRSATVTRCLPSGCQAA